MKVADVMTFNVITVSLNNAVRQAAKLMLEHKVSGLPVLDDNNKLVGVITEGDLLRRSELGFSAVADHGPSSLSNDDRARIYAKSHAWRVADVMVEGLLTVTEDAPVGQVAALMQERRVKRIPVLRNGKLVGIISRRDVLQAIVAAKPESIASGDEAIRRSILVRLSEDAGLADSNVGVTVRDGLVHLWGDVQSAACRTAARIVAEGVSGVKGVVEHFPKQAP
jgi:CBS domain-containing protein